MEARTRTFFSSFNRNIEGSVKEHLTKVYSTLTVSTLAAAVGAYVHIFTNILSAGFFSHAAGFGLLLGLFFTERTEKNLNKRLGMLMGFAFFSGMGLGPLIQYSIALDPSIVVTALIGTCFVFGSFSLSALFAKRGTFLFLGGPLLTLFTTLLGLGFANIFFRSQLIFQAHLYLGLLGLCGYVLFDTSLIMEKRRMGDKDYVSHSIDLFIDFIDIFRSLLIILSQRENEQKRRKNN